MKEVKCNLCGGEHYKVVHSGLKDDGSISLEKVYASSSNIVGNDRIVQCNECSLKYVTPQLDSKDLITAYSKGSDEQFVSQNKWRMITFKKCLNEVEKATKGEKGKILDIGTAGGAFLKVAKDSGWDAYGIEPNKWLCNWCNENYGIKIQNGTLESTNYKPKTFDVITLWDVLEHVPDPTDTLKRCKELLKDDGIIVVNYPDIGSLPAKLMGSKWVFLLSVHLWYFTPKTMKKMFIKNGFEPIKFKNHWQTLSLGYLIYRMEAYSKSLSNLGKNLVKRLRLENVSIPYWLGQTLAIAKKKSN
jgi:2-polyprenyl-3-methyl-5-hydroxy-6-metoxy-1,4-benzoquinol methylase